MSDYLKGEFLKEDGDDVEAHEFLKDQDEPRDFLKSDEGDDVEAHEFLGPKDALGSTVMRDDDKRSELL